MNITNKTILVTGGAGFIGFHTTRALIRGGGRVIIVDNLSTGRRDNIHKEALFCNINIADPKLAAIFEKEKPEIIFHFAFNVLVAESVKNPLLDADSLVGSLNLLHLSRIYGVSKIIFLSSGFIYGNNTNIPLKETEPLQPVSSYAVAKNSVENYLLFFYRTYQLPCVILRYATVYGPHQVKGAMADYIDKLKHNKQAEIWGDGSKTRDYVYIDDVVNANLAALDIPDDHPIPIFNVGTGKETSLNQLYNTIAALLNKRAAPIYHPDRPGELHRCALDCTKIKETIGWEPKIDLNEGLKMRLGL